MQTSENDNLFTDLSAEESASVNGGRSCYRRRRRFIRTGRRSHYRSYRRPSRAVNVRVRLSPRFY